MTSLQTAVIEEDYQKAAADAEALLAMKLGHTDSCLVQYYLGLSQLRLGSYARAQEVFRKLMMDKPSDEIYDRAAAGHIDTLYMQGYYENALREANGFIARRGASEMISFFHLKAARANLKLARWNKAREILEKIVAEYPDTFESRIARQLLDEKQYFTVQVGSFVDKGRAEKLVQELIARQQYAYIVEVRTPSRTNYRVRVGQMTSLKDAQELEATLAGLGYPTLIYP
jgi:tetratricopeptide (TPR) repeat protein